MPKVLHGWQLVAASLAATALTAANAAAAEDPGRQAYMQTCARCHGQVTERQSSRSQPARIIPVVMAPQGPNLTGVFGRPAGTIAGFRYSDAFRATTKGLLWDAATLDRFLADSQAMVRGSYMFQKTPEPIRATVIGYLQKYSRYRE